MAKGRETVSPLKTLSPWDERVPVGYFEKMVTKPVNESWRYHLCSAHRVCRKDNPNACLFHLHGFGLDVLDTVPLDGGQRA